MKKCPRSAHRAGWVGNSSRRRAACAAVAKAMALGLAFTAAIPRVMAAGESSAGARGNGSWPTRPLPQLNVPRAALAPKTTAQADDSAWKDSALIPNLGLSLGPDGAGKSPLPTTVRLLWDERFLYVRFECSDGEIYAPFPGGEAGRDAHHYKGDVVEVFLDPVGDGRQYLELQVSPHNGVLDGLFLLTAPAVTGPDGVLVHEVVDRDCWFFLNWNLEGLRTAASLWPQGNGWTVDVALPAAPLLKRLGQRVWRPQTIRANFLRYDSLAVGGKRDLVAMNWSPVMWGRPHRSPGAMGFLQLKP